MTSSRWPIIDTHFHIGVNAVNTIIAEDGSLIDWLDKNGIDKQFIFQVNEGWFHKTPHWNPFIGNDYIFKVQSMYQDRVIGLAHVNPWLQSPKKYINPETKKGQPWTRTKICPALDEVERAIGELGLWGLKMHPMEHNYRFNDSEVVWPVLKKLVEMQQKTKRKMIVVVHAAGDHQYNTPESIADTASHFPELLFIMAHAGFIWGYSTIFRLIGPLENVMIDLTTSPQKTVHSAIFEKYGAKRYTAGTDGPYASVSVKNAIVDDLCKNEGQKALVLGGNLAKYLDIPKIKL